MSGSDARNQINVTPLVDVVLVLLIIFLVTMPLVMRTMTVEVPRQATPDEGPPPKQVVLTQRADLSILLGDRVVNPLDLVTELRGQEVVFVDFCEGVPWGDAVETMDAVRRAEARIALRRRQGGEDPCVVR